MRRGRRGGRGAASGHMTHLHRHSTRWRTGRPFSGAPRSASFPEHERFFPRLIFQEVPNGKNGEGRVAATTMAESEYGRRPPAGQAGRTARPGSSERRPKLRAMHKAIAAGVEYGVSVPQVNRIRRPQNWGRGPYRGRQPRRARSREGCASGAVPALLDPRGANGPRGSRASTESLRTGRSGGCAEDGCRVTGMGGIIVCPFLLIHHKSSQVKVA